MAIIYSYPITTPENTDLFIISRNPSDPDEISNFSITTDALANFITARVNLDFTGDTGTGIVNLDTQTLSIVGTVSEIETTANAQTLQIGLPDDVIIANDLTIGGDFTGVRGIFSDDLSVGSDLSVINGTVETDSLQVNNTADISGVLTMEDDIDMTENGRIINLEDPVDPQDAVTKAYVDSQNTGQVTGTGSTNVLPKWTDGGNSVLGDSNILDNGEKIIIPGLYGLTVGNNQLPASAFNSVVFGENNTIAGKYSFASGQQNTAGAATGEGNDATALGFGNTASGMQTLATGANTTASGPEAASFGNATTASGGRAIATGFETTASGLNALSLGNATSAIGNNSIAAGINITSNANNSFAFGANLLNSNKSSLVVGEWNADNANLKFSVGAGFSSGSGRHNVFEVYKNGNFNIGDLSGFNNKARIGSDGNSIDIISNGVTIASFNGETPTNSFIKLGGTGAANTLDDYEEGTFNLQWAYASVGSVGYYDIDDFGGVLGSTKSDNSRYVKVGRHVTVTSQFRYASIPSAWTDTSALIFLKLPFTVATGYYGNGTYLAFPGLASTNPGITSTRPSLFPTSYSVALSLLGFDSGNTSVSYGQFESFRVSQLPPTGPSGYVEFKISFSFYTTD